MIAQRLMQREAQGNPILVGATAEGWMGSGFIAQMAHVPGMR